MLSALISVFPVGNKRLIIIITIKVNLRLRYVILLRDSFVHSANPR